MLPRFGSAALRPHIVPRAILSSVADAAHVAQEKQGAARHTPRSDVQAEEWVAAEIDGTDTDAVFSEPMTIDELAKSRDMLTASYAASCEPETDVLSNASTDSIESVDANEQMQCMQAHSRRSNFELNDIFDLSLKMAANKDVQRTLFHAIRTDNALYHSFQRVAAGRGISIRLEPVGDRAALEGSAAADAHSQACPDSPRSEIEFAGAPNLEEFMQALGRRIGALGEGLMKAVRGFLDRTLRHVAWLLNLHRGERMVKNADGELVTRGQTLLDVALSVATLLVVVTLLRRVQ